MYINALILIGGMFLGLVWWYHFREQIGPHYANTLMKQSSYTPFSLKILWIIRIGIFLCVIALWIDPHMTTTSKNAVPDNNSIIITLDISKSMQSDDINPSRIEKAKEVINTLIKNNPRDSIGLVIFAGKTFLMAPPGRDRSGLSAIVSTLTTDSIDQAIPDTSGTNLGDGILRSIDSLQKSGSGKKSIIIVTDGRANVGIDPLIAAETAKIQNIRLYTVGIGGSSGSSLSYLDSAGIRRYFYDAGGKRIVADRDDATLGAIAKITGGKYFLSDDASILEASMGNIGDIVRGQLTYEYSTIKTSLSPIIAIALFFLALIHMIIGLFIRNRAIR